MEKASEEYGSKETGVAGGMDDDDDDDDNKGSGVLISDGCIRRSELSL